MAYELPVPEPDRKKGRIPIFTVDGLRFMGTLYPYVSSPEEPENPNETTDFIGTDDELVVKTRGGKELVFRLAAECSHQLLDLQGIVQTHLMQRSLAQFAPPDEDGASDLIVNGPAFNMSKVVKGLEHALSF